MHAAAENLVFFDLETAGIAESSAIIQIAAIAVNSQLRELDSFETKIRFDIAGASTDALAKNCFEPTVWKRLARRPDEAAKRFGDFLRQHATVDMVSARTGKPYQLSQLVAHNAAFDGPMLQAWFKQRGMFLPASRRVFCTMQRALWLFHEHQDMTPPANYKLGTLCEYFSIPLSDDEAHDAIADVRATVELYRMLMAGKEIGTREAA